MLEIVTFQYEKGLITALQTCILYLVMEQTLFPWWTFYLSCLKTRSNQTETDFGAGTDGRSSQSELEKSSRLTWPAIFLWLSSPSYLEGCTALWGKVGPIQTCGHCRNCDGRLLLISKSRNIHFQIKSHSQILANSDSMIYRFLQLWLDLYKSKRYQVISGGQKMALNMTLFTRTSRSPNEVEKCVYQYCILSPAFL